MAAEKLMLFKKYTSYLCGLAALTSFAFHVNPLQAEETPATHGDSVTIANNSGGVIINFAMKLAHYRQAGILVKFKGRCDSSCTLFLGLPRQQTCISEGAVFRFHSPTGMSQRATRTAQAFMMETYPSWVKNWIYANGGLSGQLMSMNYAYASQYISDCSKVASL